ncbi:MAG: putative quinol monooxygenase [Pseudomonadota bacterium]
MIVVAGHLEVVEAHAEEAAAIARAMMAETRREPGCLLYRITRDLDAPGRFHIYEEWESAEALEAHFERPHMGVFRAGLADLTVISREIHRREAGVATAL